MKNKDLNIKPEACQRSRKDPQKRRHLRCFGLPWRAWPCEGMGEGVDASWPHKHFEPPTKGLLGPLKGQCGLEEGEVRLWRRLAHQISAVSGLTRVPYLGLSKKCCHPLGWWNSSLGRGTSCQVWQPDFEPKTNMVGVSRFSKVLLCVIVMCSGTCIHTHTLK